MDCSLRSLISEWYHYAILSLLELPEAQFTSLWISKRLGITRIEATAAMELLQRLHLITSFPNGKWRQNGLPINVENKISNAATRKFQKQVLEKALESLEHDSKETRDLSSMTFAMDSTLIPYAIEQIRAFRRNLVQDLESKGNPDLVYNLAVQLYPISNITAKKR